MELFSASDIKWVRNVKREQGTAWAYSEIENEFLLHWSSVYKNEKEAAKPKPGELILLIQRPNKIINGTFLTHLVSPVDNYVHDVIDTNPNHRWARKVMVIAKPESLNAILKPTSLNLSKVSRSHSFKIERISVNNKVDKQLVQNTLWNAFLPHLNKKADLQFLELDIELRNEELALLEGKEREVLSKHIIRERKSELVIQKKNISPEILSCECCSFNFYSNYGEHGKGYIECHHRVPIHKGERITKLSDLALVCSNCHRMLHRKNNHGNYFTVEELKNNLNK